MSYKKSVQTLLAFLVFSRDCHQVKFTVPNGNSTKEKSGKFREQKVFGVDDLNVFQNLREALSSSYEAQPFISDKYHTAYLLVTAWSCCSCQLVKWNSGFSREMIMC